MNFLEIYDPITGKRKKRKLGADTPTQSELQSNIQKIAPNPTRDKTIAYDARPHQMGAPRVQGFNGVNQGAMGWLANLNRGNMQQVNSILQKLSQPKRYNMPAFTTDNALSSDWFNTALKRIQVRNQMKMDLARQRALASALSPLLNAQSADRRSGVAYLNNLLSNATDMQKAKMINQTKSNELNEQKRWHDIMRDYYNGLLSAKEQGSEETKNDPYKTAKIQNDRYKLFMKSPSSIIPQWDDLDENDKRLALDYFVKTGSIPQVQKVDDGWFSDTYKVVIPNSGVSNVDQNQTQASTPSINGMKVLDEKVSSDGKRYVKLEDGRWYEY